MEFQRSDFGGKGECGCADLVLAGQRVRPFDQRSQSAGLVRSKCLHEWRSERGSRSFPYWTCVGGKVDGEILKMEDAEVRILVLGILHFSDEPE